MGSFWDNITPWNTQNERNENAKNLESKKKLEAELVLKTAGVEASKRADELKALSEQNKVYIVLAIIVFFIVIGLVTIKIYGK